MMNFKHKMRWLGISVFFVMMPLGSVVTAIEGSSEILPIQPVPSIQEPIAFQGGGTIQRVGHDEVGKKLMVIDDRLMYLAKNIKYYDAQGKVTSSIKFSAGKLIGYFYNKKRELTTLYLLKD